jgi:hypothetical protein
MKKLVAVSAAVLITGGSLLGFAAPSFADDSGSSTGVSGVVSDSTTTTTAAPVQTTAPAPAEVATPTPAPTKASQAVATPAPAVTPSPAPAVVRTTPAVVPQPKPPVDTGATINVSWLVPTGGTEAAPFAGGAQTLYTDQCGYGGNLIQNDLYHYGTPSAIQLVNSLKASGTLDNYADTPVFISATWSYLPLCVPAAPPVGSFTPATCTAGATYTLPVLGLGWKYALQADGSRPVAGTFSLPAGQSVAVVAHTTSDYTPGEVDFNYTGQDQIPTQSTNPSGACYVAPPVVVITPTTEPEPYNGKCSVDGTDNGGYTVPTIDHITYNVVSSTADSVHLTATADAGYSIHGATEWFLDWNNPGKFQSTSPGLECYVAPVVVVTPPPATTPATPTILTTSPEASASDTAQDGVLAHTGSSINFAAYAMIASVLLAIGALFLIISVTRRRYDNK